MFLANSLHHLNFMNEVYVCVYNIYFVCYIWQNLTKNFFFFETSLVRISEFCFVMYKIIHDLQNSLLHILTAELLVLSPTSSWHNKEVGLMIPHIHVWKGCIQRSVIYFVPHRLFCVKQSKELTSACRLYETYRYSLVLVTWPVCVCVCMFLTRGPI